MVKSITQITFCLYDEPGLFQVLPYNVAKSRLNSYLARPEPDDIVTQQRWSLLATPSPIPSPIPSPRPNPSLNSSSSPSVPVAVLHCYDGAYIHNSVQTSQR